MTTRMFVTGSVWVATGVWVIVLIYLALLTWIMNRDFGRKIAIRFAALSFFWLSLGVIAIIISG